MLNIQLRIAGERLKGDIFQCAHALLRNNVTKRSEAKLYIIINRSHIRLYYQVYEIMLLCYCCQLFTVNRFTRYTR